LKLFWQDVGFEERSVCRGDSSAGRRWLFLCHTTGMISVRKYHHILHDHVIPTPQIFPDQHARCCIDQALPDADPEPPAPTKISHWNRFSLSSTDPSLCLAVLVRPLQANVGIICALCLFCLTNSVFQGGPLVEQGAKLGLWVCDNDCRTCSLELGVAAPPHDRNHTDTPQNVSHHHQW
jgi:hypothetical protein